MAKIFIFIGVVFILIGLLLYFFKDFPLFHLPGDIVIKKENFVFYFPITSSVLISVVLSVVFYIISKIMQ
ncbi:MAG: DUF2905 domain-containing protein [Epsilonproteobacteria bacterium]|nr:DUF2905 domain-containing protein [Campylobacterota bacterium]